ncbi:B3 domain-containing protein At1g49475-like [Juglans microcarpa x Juglans regia]|uniref:B3 domain-containing protein At1g49475-like n=1 Tax=Juglans microcarpa x Juglans regia TaxID=2249226 RepID=UPI001B7E8449|nr:B3 domain-containing protein At1g49475-like [Juglans microcarpa x Juglans regia]
MCMAAAGNISKNRRSGMFPNWKYDQHRRPSSSVAGRRPAHFFKIMLPSAMAQKKLRIPVKFVRLFGDELPTVVTLILPNGCSWQVGLERATHEKEIWFHKGWHDFVEYHSIDSGHFLVFRYEGNSNFHVLVFDKTSTEIQYSSKNLDDDHTIMVSDDDVEKSSHDDKSKETREIILSKHKDGETSDHDRERPVVLSGTSTKERSLRMSRGRERAIQAAITFKPKNPSFMRIMPRSSASYRMYVPSGFATSYLSLNQSIKLQTSDENDGQREWHVICRCHHNRQPRLSLKLGSGWKVFARDNNLKEGDAFVFELVQRNPTVLKVSIFRVVDYV